MQDDVYGHLPQRRTPVEYGKLPDQNSETSSGSMYGSPQNPSLMQEVNIPERASVYGHLPDFRTELPDPAVKY